MEVLRPYMPVLHLSPGWGISSPSARDGKLRAVDTGEAGFHTSVAVATPLSGSKSCGLYFMGHAPRAVYREKIRTVEELQ